MNLIFVIAKNRLLSIYTRKEVECILDCSTAEVIEGLRAVTLFRSDVYVTTVSMRNSFERLHYFYLIYQGRRLVSLQMDL